MRPRVRPCALFGRDLAVRRRRTDSRARLPFLGVAAIRNRDTHAPLALFGRRRCGAALCHRDDGRSSVALLYLGIAQV